MHQARHISNTDKIKHINKRLECEMRRDKNNGIVVSVILIF